MQEVRSGADDEETASGVHPIGGASAVVGDVDDDAEAAATGAEGGGGGAGAAAGRDAGARGDSPRMAEARPSRMRSGRFMPMGGSIRRERSKSNGGTICCMISATRCAFFCTDMMLRSSCSSESSPDERPRTMSSQFFGIFVEQKLFFFGSELQTMYAL